MGVLSSLLSGVVDVGKDIVKETVPKIGKAIKERGILSKEKTALENYAKRVAKAWVEQPTSTTGDKSVAKDLGTILKEESGRLGKEMLLGLIPFLPTVEEDNGGDKTNEN